VGCIDMTVPVTCFEYFSTSLSFALRTPPSPLERGRATKGRYNTYCRVLKILGISKEVVLSTTSKVIVSDTAPSKRRRVQAIALERASPREGSRANKVQTPKERRRRLMTDREVCSLMLRRNPLVERKIYSPLQ
jgi:hypothetical protein